MKIDLQGRIPQAPESAAAANSAGTRKSSSPGGRAVDTAELSGLQETAKRLSAAVLAQPEIRQERVAALAQQIQSGNYRTTPGQTAEALLSQLRSGEAA